MSAQHWQVFVTTVWEITIVVGWLLGYSVGKNDQKKENQDVKTIK